MPFFSARLHVICIVDAEGHEGNPPKYTCDYPFVLFEAADDDEAFNRAISLGKQQECRYQNSSGETVRWALRAVEEIWRLPDQLDGIEIGSILDVYQSDTRFSIDTMFEPERIKPQISNVNLY